MNPITLIYKIFLFLTKFIFKIFILFLAIVGIAAIITGGIFYFDPVNSLFLLETKKIILEETIHKLKNKDNNKNNIFNFNIKIDKNKKAQQPEQPFPEYLKWDDNTKQNKHLFVKNPNSLVFSGGGPRGVAYVGVLKYLQETDRLKNIKRFIGTSAGSIMCTFMSIATYYEKNKKPESKPFWEHINDIMLKTNFIDFIDDPVLKKNIIGKKSVKLDFQDLAQSFNLLANNFALCKGTEIYKFFEDSLEKSGLYKNITLKELYEKTGNHLVLVSCSLSYRKAAYFDYKTVPDMPVAEAMRASMAIPFVFEPVHYNNDYFVDGGISNNYPITYFDYINERTESPISCLGFVLTSKNKILKPEFDIIDNIGNYTFGVFKLLLDNTSSALYTKNVDRTVFIDCGKIGTTSFLITDEQKLQLIEAAYKTTKKYFEM